MNIITIFEEVDIFIYICIKNGDGVFRGSSEKCSFLAWKEVRWMVKKDYELTLNKRRNVLIFELYKILRMGLKVGWDVIKWKGLSNEKKIHTKIKSTQQGWMIRNLILKIYYFSAFNDGILNFNENIPKDKLKNIIMIKFLIIFPFISVIQLLINQYLCKHLFRILAHQNSFDSIKYVPRLIQFPQYTVSYPFYVILFDMLQASPFYQPIIMERDSFVFTIVTKMMLCTLRKTVGWYYLTPST